MRCLEFIHSFIHSFALIDPGRREEKGRGKPGEEQYRGARPSVFAAALVGCMCAQVANKELGALESELEQLRHQGSLDGFGFYLCEPAASTNAARNECGVAS
jgi:hypothetical protein